MHTVNTPTQNKAQKNPPPGFQDRHLCLQNCGENRKQVSTIVIQIIHIQRIISQFMVISYSQNNSSFHVVVLDTLNTIFRFTRLAQLYKTRKKKIWCIKYRNEITKRTSVGKIKEVGTRKILRWIYICIFIHGLFL